MRLPVMLLAAALLAGLAAPATACAEVAARVPPEAAAATDAPLRISSIHAEELRAHPDDARRFAPGAAVTVPLRLPSVAGGTAAADAAPATLAAAALRPTREVFGYLPYWSLGASTTRLDYSLLSTIAYFGVGVDRAGRIVKSVNGSTEVGWAGWASAAMTGVIDDAHAQGARVALTVYSFGWTSSDASNQRALLMSATARTTFAQQVAGAVADRHADGVNLDFEPIVSGCPGTCYSQFVALVRAVRAELDRRGSGLALTVSNTGWLDPAYPAELLTAAGAADAIFIMGYDYRLDSSSTAGAVAPLAGSGYDLTETVAAYTKRVPPGKLILGLPYYGRAWSTSSTALNAAVTGACPSAAVYYRDALEFSSDHGRRYDSTQAAAWTAYSKSGCSGYRELYYDDAQSLGAKYDLVNRSGLRGAGIWALGFDGTLPDLWNALRAKFGGSAEPPAPAGGMASTYVPVSPFRLVDTRQGLGLAGAVRVGTPGRVQVGGKSPIPAAAVAVTGNLTTTGSTSRGYLSLSAAPPPDPLRPPSSTLNFPMGEDRANGVTAALGTSGELYVTFAGAPAGSSSGVVFDVTGYYLAGTSGLAFHGLAPARLVDTRSGLGLGAALLAGRPGAFAVAGKCGVPASARAVTGNLTVVSPTARGFLFLGPAIPSPIPASTLNSPAGDVRANNVTIPLAADGSLSVVFAGPAGARAPVVFDVTGYFDAGPGGAAFVPLAPSRLLDTRTSGGPIATGTARPFVAAGRSGIPAGAVAVAANVTITAPTSGGWLAISPSASPPSTSTINFPVGDTRANGAVTLLGTGGTMSAFFRGGAGSSVQLIVDVSGYFAAP